MSDIQITNHVVMVRPSNFGFNPETAKNNTFQTHDEELTSSEISELAIAEFNNLVRKLKDHHIDVLVWDDTQVPKKADAVFPNNWVSFHQNGTAITYPMYSPIRREERSEDILKKIEERFKIKKRYSFEYYEGENKYLEGTGSMILDRKHKVVYACLSERTDPQVLEKFVVLSGYQKVIFNAIAQNAPIYHTNVMMALGTSFVVVCLDSIENVDERKVLLQSFDRTGKEVIDITIDQMHSFAGNMLQLGHEQGEHILVMSEKAFKSLEPEQVHKIMEHTEIMYADIPTIEKYGGGSVRCMIAENFLPLR